MLIVCLTGLSTQNSRFRHCMVPYLHHACVLRHIKLCTKIESEIIYDINSYWIRFNQIRMIRSKTIYNKTIIRLSITISGSNPTYDDNFFGLSLTRNEPSSLYDETIRHKMHCPRQTVIRRGMQFISISETSFHASLYPWHVEIRNVTNCGLWYLISDEGFS
jgi:hypothetical protein